MSHHQVDSNSIPDLNQNQPEKIIENSAMLEQQQEEACNNPIPDSNQNQADKIIKNSAMQEQRQEEACMNPANVVQAVIENHLEEERSESASSSFFNGEHDFRRRNRIIGYYPETDEVLERKRLNYELENVSQTEIMLDNRLARLDMVTDRHVERFFNTGPGLNYFDRLHAEAECQKSLGILKNEEFHYDNGFSFQLSIVVDKNSDTNNVRVIGTLKESFKTINIEDVSLFVEHSPRFFKKDNYETECSMFNNITNNTLKIMCKKDAKDQLWIILNDTSLLQRPPASDMILLSMESYKRIQYDMDVKEKLDKFNDICRGINATIGRIRIQTKNELVEKYFKKRNPKCVTEEYSEFTVHKHLDSQKMKLLKKCVSGPYFMITKSVLSKMGDTTVKSLMKELKAEKKMKFYP